MKIDKIQNEKQLTLILEGELDSVQSKFLEEEVNNLPQEVTDLIFDMEKLEYTSSAGIRAFLLANKIMKDKNGSMKMLKVNSNIYEILKMASLVDVLDVETL